MVGMAMTGNLESAGRYFVELRNLNETLGEKRHNVSKSAYGMEFFQTKTNDALSQMPEHERRVREVSLAYRDLKGLSVGF